MKRLFLFAYLVGIALASTTRLHLSARDLGHDSITWLPSHSATPLFKRSSHSDTSMRDTLSDSDGETKSHLPAHTRLLDKIIDLYPRFGIESGALMPTSPSMQHLRRYDRTMALRCIQEGIARFGTVEQPPLFSKPLYTLSPDVPMDIFVRYIIDHVPAPQYSPTRQWLAENANEVVDSLSGLTQYAMENKNTLKKAETDPTVLQQWYARLAHYGMVSTPTFHNHLSFLQAYGKRVFRNVPLGWIPGYAQMDENLRGDVAFLYHQLLLIKILQAVLAEPELVTAPSHDGAAEAQVPHQINASDDESRLERLRENKRNSRMEQRRLHHGPLRMPGQRGPDRGPRMKRMRTLDKEANGPQTRGSKRLVRVEGGRLHYGPRRKPGQRGPDRGPRTTKRTRLLAEIGNEPAAENNTGAEETMDEDDVYRPDMSHLTN